MQLRKQPLRRLSTWEYTKRYVPLDFDIEDIPHMKRPLELMDTVLNARFIFNGPIQTWKTLIVTLTAYRNFDHRPVRSGFFNRTGDAVKEWAEDKFHATLETIEPLQDIILKEKKKILHMQFAHGLPFRALTAGTRANRNSKTLEELITDELWEYDPGWLKEIEGRASARDIAWRSQVKIPSSGFTKNSEGDKVWEESTREEWYVECLDCGEYFNFVFDQGTDDEGKRLPGGMRFDHDSPDVKLLDGTLNRVAFMKSIFYECPHCGSHMTYSPKLVEELNRTGEWTQTNPNPSHNVYGFHWDSVQFKPWPKLVDDWRIAQEAKRRGDYSLLEECVRKERARSWSVREHVKFKTVDNAGDYREKSEHPGDIRRLKELAAAAERLFMTIDVQQDHFYYRIRTWGTGIESRGIAYGRILTPDHLRKIQLEWNIPDHGGQFDQAACGVFIDGNYNTQQVRKIAAEYSWYVLRGRDGGMDFTHEDGIKRIYSRINYVDAYQGTSEQGRHGVVGEFYYSQPEARNRLALLRDLKDPAAWTHGKDVSTEYIKQINAWQKQVGERKKDGAEVVNWIQTNKDDHYGDTEKMQIVPASMAHCIGAESLDTKPKEETNTPTLKMSGPID